MKVFSWLACLSGLFFMCVPSECLMVLEAVVMGLDGGRKYGREDLCDSLG